MKFLITLLLVAVPIASRADEIPNGFSELKWAPPTAIEWLTLTPAIVLIGADISTTLAISDSPTAREMNPLLGSHPTRTRVLVTGFVSEGLTVGTWYALPPRIRWTVPLIVTAVESLMVAGNLNRGLSFKTPW